MEAPPVVGQDEIDAIIIVGRWLARYGELRRVVRLPATLNTGIAREIFEVACRVRSPESIDADPEADWVDPDA
jgi:hypothetical protein